jgi:hypothetical protein
MGPGRRAGAPRPPCACVEPNEEEDRVTQPDTREGGRELVDADAAYLNRVIDFVEGKASAAGAEAHDKCALGRWYYESGAERPRQAAHPKFPELGVVHMAFHLACEEAVRSKAAGEVEAARSALTRAAELAGQVRAALAAVLASRG